MSLGDERRWERYMQRFAIDDNGCWNWTGKIKGGGRTGGYAIVSVERRDVRLHRLFYERFVGPIPDGLEVCHSCDNRRCVNPEHLWVGTHRQNIDDMVAKGRRRRTHCPKGHPLGDRVYSDGSRCVTCRRARGNRYDRRQRAGLAVVVAVVALAVGPQTADADVTTGDTGPEVRIVQEHLKWMGYSVAVDGVFGKQTERAVRHFQRASGLSPDAVVGPLTSSALGIRGDTVQLTQPPSPPPPQTVEQIIRAAWPDELEDHALAIAWRESRWQPTARNACCFGLFQIHWPVHRTWLATQGVTSADQLLDAATNARIAVLVYERSNGWGPWRL